MSDVVERTVTVASKEGLHARPASLFVKAAQGLSTKVTVSKAGSDPVPADSMLSIMALGAKQGEEVTLRAEGEGAQAAVDELAKIVETDLDAS